MRNQNMLKLATALGLTLLVLLPVRATDRLGTDVKPWEGVEQQLIDRGLGTSTPELLAIVRSDENPSNRWAAIEVLGLRHEAAAEPLLLEIMVAESDPLLRESAALALARLGEQEGVEVLRQALDSREEGSRRLYLAARLAELGEPAGYPYVVAAASAESADLRASSVASLVAFVPPTAPLDPDPLSLLETLGRDECAAVRRELLIHLPIVVEQGVEAGVFCPLVSAMAREDADPEIRDMAKLYRGYGAFQTCGGEDGTP